jgi:hypothetical protein
MRVEVANRLNGIGEYYFSQKLKEIDDLNKQGKAVINLGIGSPTCHRILMLLRYYRRKQQSPTCMLIKAIKAQNCCVRHLVDGTRNGMVQN